IRSYGPEWVFVDQWMRSRDWISSGCNGTWDLGGKRFSTDADGWITSADSGVCPTTMILDSNSGRYPAGTYVMLWDGKGAIYENGKWNPTFNIWGDVSNFQVTGDG